jgi:dynein light chain Tctex-type 1
MDSTNAARYDDKAVKDIISGTIEATVGSQSYQQAKMNTWTSNIVEIILNSVLKLNKPFKYVVSCVIMQKNGAALHTASSCFWDSAHDDSSTIRYELKLLSKKNQSIYFDLFSWENKSMYVIVSVFGLSI